MAITGVVWNFKQGEHATLVAVGVDTTDPTGWGLLFTFVPYAGASAATYTKTPTVSGPNLDGKYSLTVFLTRAETLTLLNFGTDGPKKMYSWDIWRTDTGFDVPLVSGTSEVSAPARLAA